MSRDVIFQPSAQDEYAGAVAHYDSISEGLGRAFLTAVREMESRLVDSPFLYAEVAAGMRIAPLKRFPYALIYSVQEDVIGVVSVFHMRRNLDAWLNAYLN